MQVFLDSIAQDGTDDASAPVDATCPQCGREDRTLQPGKGPHAGQEVCAWCGQWLRWVSREEYEQRVYDEVPF